jgi:hypothetical protein
MEADRTSGSKGLSEGLSKGLTLALGHGESVARDEVLWTDE